ncbi:hypothetical protein [Lentilactobacillus kosonis]|uniref:Uncharacterized protein n=1 Tax=Lentilactobacillus kosonis TaxID=2810561 RepID=A0A401FHX5_9LACO|nr:hypothetical protein [Lentilactobacillus kosonis]GAY71964.1 hypothetical protein NBRC111893_110 [Lentilactobacillus kosonis]
MIKNKLVWTLALFVSLLAGLSGGDVLTVSASTDSISHSNTGSAKKLYDKKVNYSKEGSDLKIIKSQTSEDNYTVYSGNSNVKIIKENKAKPASKANKAKLVSKSK